MFNYPPELINFHLGLLHLQHAVTDVVQEVICSKEEKESLAFVRQLSPLGAFTEITGQTAHYNCNSYQA